MKLKNVQEIMNKIVISWLILLIVFCCNERPNSKKKKMEMKKESPVLFSAKLLTSEIRVGSPILVEVTLKNNSDTSVLVNKRMSVGYKKSLSRELYADLRYNSDDQNVPYYESDINRDFSLKSDYVDIQPGENLSETIDLMQFYTPNGPGKYLLTLYYQADEELASIPENLLRNVYSSNTISFEVLSNMEKVDSNIL